MPHLLQRYRQGCGVSKGHHGQGITYEHSVGSSLFNKGARQAVPSRENGDGSSVLFVPDQLVGTQGEEIPREHIASINGTRAMRFGRPNLVRTGR